MLYSTDLTDEQWALLEPVFNAPGKRGPKHAPDLRRRCPGPIGPPTSKCYRQVFFIDIMDILNRWEGSRIEVG